MVKQLTMQDVLNLALKLQEKGLDLSKIKVYLGNDDELNGIHNAWYCEIIENNGDEENNIVVDLINENIGNHVEDLEKFVLIS